MSSSWKATDDLTLSGTIIHVGSWEEKPLPITVCQRSPHLGFTTVNLAADYGATDRITLFGRIDNLFNVILRMPFPGYLRPSFGIFAGVKVTTKVADFNRTG